jgi:hypothetical protein
MFQTILLTFVICLQIIHSPDVFDIGKIMQVNHEGYSNELMWYNGVNDTLLMLTEECKNCHIVVVNITDC